ncbi:MAG TPA: hypothetical protein DD001_17750 [Microcoleaceae bacterium UBA10368]|nr:hypothetical protein [Microcoleaceae cyanobacterium UBA10368]
MRGVRNRVFTDIKGYNQYSHKKPGFLGGSAGWSETGFLPILKAITSILTKNPVSWVGVRKSYDF